jgi:hypothetical protein
MGHISWTPELTWTAFCLCVDNQCNRGVEWELATMFLQQLMGQAVTKQSVIGRLTVAGLWGLVGTGKQSVDARQAMLKQRRQLGVGRGVWCLEKVKVGAVEGKQEAVYEARVVREKIDNYFSRTQG